MQENRNVDVITNATKPVLGLLEDLRGIGINSIPEFKAQLENGKFGLFKKTKSTDEIQKDNLKAVLEKRFGTGWEKMTFTEFKNCGKPGLVRITQDKFEQLKDEKLVCADYKQYHRGVFGGIRVYARTYVYVWEIENNQRVQLKIRKWQN